VVEHSAPLPEGFGELAGQQVDFRVLVTSVSRKVLPEVSDEWITEISEFDTVDDFKADLSEAIDVAKKKVLLRRFREGAVARLTEGVTVPIPQAIVDLEAQDVVNQFAHRLGREGITLENYMEVTGLDQNRLMEDARNQAENNLRTRLALEAIASTENIQVTGEDLTRFIESASANSEKPEQTRRLLQSRAAVIVGDILRSRAMDVVLSTATPVDDKGNPVDLSEVDGGGSVETEPESDELENNVREVVDGEGSESDNLEAVVEATTETLAEDASEDSTEASGEEE
jgi:trigger factor